MYLKQILFSTIFLGLTTVATAELNINGNQVSASFKDMTLEAALSEIAEATDIRILASHPLDATVHIGFKQTSLDKMLTRLLAGYNVSYLRNPDNTIKEIRIFAVGSAPKINKTPQSNGNDGQAQHENGHFYVNVTINGTSVRLLVDTGASRLTLSKQLAQQLQLTPENSHIAVETAGGKAQGSTTIIDSFIMAGKELKGVQAVILPQLKESGLLGQNILAHYRRITEGESMRFEAIGNPASNTETQPSQDNKQKSPETPTKPMKSEAKK